MTETKYYLAGTDEEVLVGDVIETTLVKEFDDGRSITRKISFELSEESIPYALDMHIIEQKENEDLVDFNNEENEEDEEELKCPFEGMIDDIMEDYEKLEKRVEKLEEKIKNKLDTIATLEDEIKKFKEWQSSFLAKYYVDKAKENKTASSKKK